MSLTKTGNTEHLQVWEEMINPVLHVLNLRGLRKKLLGMLNSQPNVPCPRREAEDVYTC